jgi:hypothetical protein
MKTLTTLTTLKALLARLAGPRGAAGRRPRRSRPAALRLQLLEDRLTPMINSTTSLALTPSTAVFGEPVTMTATVTPGATGAVTFLDGTTPLGIGYLSAGQATFTTNGLGFQPSNTHTITAHYNADEAFLPSTSSPLTETIRPPNTTTSLTSSASAGSVYGQSVLFTATVRASGSAAPTGAVVFSDGGTQLATVTQPTAAQGNQATYTYTTATPPTPRSGSSRWAPRGWRRSPGRSSRAATRRPLTTSRPATGPPTAPTTTSLL